MKTKLTLLIAFILSTGYLQAQLNITPSQMPFVVSSQIEGPSKAVTFGNSIHLSKDGNTLAIADKNYTYDLSKNKKGLVRVYTNQNGSWVQKGQDLTSIQLGIYNAFGSEVILSSDGNTLAVYDPQIPVILEAGQTLVDKIGTDEASKYFPYAQLFKFENNSWSKIGNDLKFTGALYNGIKMSRDGNTIALIKDSVIEIHQRNANNWNKISELTTTTTGIEKAKITLSEDGSIIVIADKDYSVSTSTVTYEGQVKVFKNTANTWSQLGQTIVGSESLQFFGSDISISSNGEILAVVSRRTQKKDFVSLYELVNNTWTQKGSNIVEHANSSSSASKLNIELSDDGNRIIIAEENNVRLLQFKTDWEQVNKTIERENNSDNFPEAISLSGDGSHFAVSKLNVGTPDIVKIYEENKNSITRFGDEIYGIGDYNSLGQTVSVSENGNIIAVGAPGQHRDKAVSRVQVYEKTSNGLVQIGNDILSPEKRYETGAFGSVVELSADGSLVAISAPLLYGSNYGAVYIYQRNGDNWVPYGKKIGGTYGSRTGASISFSKDASILAVGSFGNPGGVNNDRNRGYTTVYKYNNTNATWEVLGEKIIGEAYYDLSGCSVSLSGDGTILAIGAKGNNGETTNGAHGHVRVFKFNNNAWKQMGSDIDGDPNFNSDFGGRVRLFKDGKTLLVSDTKSQSGAGSVNIYTWNETTNKWDFDTQLKTFLSSGVNNSHRYEFGHDLSVSDNGKILAIGEYRWTPRSGYRHKGKVHIYIKTNDGWKESELFLEGRQRDQYFGEAVSLSGNGNTLVVGGYNYGYYDANVASYAGMAGVYELNLCSTLDDFEVAEVIDGIYTSIPDKNFEQYLIDNQIDKEGKLNGKVLTADIKNVTSIVVSKKNIRNLTGIEDFTSLTELIASKNDITNIDLSKNTLLERLYVANNNLSNINLSKNNKIKYLDVSENQLTKLDIHLLTDLETLSCSENKLTELNVISNKKLNVFVANDNQLKQLDFRVNEELYKVNVANNKLKSLVMKNGTNSKINGDFFDATGNSNLTCIEVDNVTYSEANWLKKDATVSYATNCAPANDTCIDAIPLLFGQETTGDVNNGTITNNPSCKGGNVIADVWFTVEVPETQEFSVQGIGLGGLLKFAIFKSCNGTNEIACGTNISLKNLTPKAIYYLKVWMEEDAPKGTRAKNGNASFTITASESSTLSNENYIKNFDGLQLYPNPATTNVTISLPNNEQINEVTIFNLLGKRVALHKEDTTNATIPVNELSSGIYIVTIKGRFSNYTKKLIIK